MSLLGIVVAMEEEVSSILDSMHIEKKIIISYIRYYVGTFKGKKIVVSICGIGKVNAAVGTQSLILNFSPDLILNIGLAGAANPKLFVGNLVIAKEVVQHDVDTTALGDPLGMVSTVNIVKFQCSKDLTEKFFYNLKSKSKVFLGTVASGDKFLKEKSVINIVRKNFNALAVDMESGSIAQVCYLNKAKFCCLKIISDSAFSAESGSVAGCYNKSKENFPDAFCDLLKDFIKILN